MPVRTLQSYVQILQDTLIGVQVPAFRATKKRKTNTRSRFFFFDAGVVNSLTHRGIIQAKRELFGKCFEHFLFLELRAYLSYRRSERTLAYWRSTSGFEVPTTIRASPSINSRSSSISCWRSGGNRSADLR